MKITMITHIVLSKKYETLIELSDRLERKKNSLFETNGEK